MQRFDQMVTKIGILFVYDLRKCDFRNRADLMCGSYVANMQFSLFFFYCAKVENNYFNTLGSKKQKAMQGVFCVV